LASAVIGRAVRWFCRLMTSSPLVPHRRLPAAQIAEQMASSGDPKGQHQDDGPTVLTRFVLLTYTGFSRFA